ncbi:MAG TPA: cytochrome c oxidase assembly protein, partial [Gemmataceae bacterium]
MSPTLDACLRSWPFDPWLLGALLFAVGVYLRGWLVLHRRDPRRWHGGRLAAFFGGLASIYLALASPIEPFAALLLQVHMLQHLLLMMAAAPLLWLGAPLFPLLRGLPRSIRIFWAVPLLSSPPLRRSFGRLTHPLTALLLFLVATWFWHVPAVYNLALRSSGWHYLQHVCFLGTALLFWYPVVRPYPTRPRWSSWLLLPVLLLADLSNTILSALLTFSDGVLYSYYAEVPRLGGLSAIEDQSAAGVLMWVPGSIVFLLPLFAIGIQLLSGTQSRDRQGAEAKPLPHGRGSAQHIPARSPRRVSLPLVSSSLTSDLRPLTSGFDLLRV